jgi:NitT/TauT family transport system permease protein
VIRKPISGRAALALGALSIGLLLVGYTWLSWRQHQRIPDDTTIPGWGQILEGVISIVTPHERTGDVWLWDDSLATLGRLFGGLGLGVLLSVVFGFLMGCWTPAEAFLLPPLRLAAKLNPIAMLAVFFVMVGTGTEMYLAMVVFGVVPVLSQNVYLAARNDVPEQLVHKAYTLGASTMETVVHVVGAQVLPRLLEGIRLLIGPALVYLVASEMLVGDVGFGYRIRLQQRLQQMAVVYPYIAVLGLYGYLLDRAVQWLSRRLSPWYGRSS